MLCRGLTTLDELDKVEAYKQHKAKVCKQEKLKSFIPIDTSSPPGLNLALTIAFTSFNPFNSY
jgi:hypothetical protein